MHDFGEYNPLDSISYDGVDPFLNHNDYPAQWALVVKEAIEESGVDHADQIIPFMRSGSSLSPKDTRLFWMGDQIPTFDQYDGMWSALIGQLNGGLSGYTLGHSDIGGFTTIVTSILGKEIPLVSYTRSKELLLRWIEMSTFSDMIMRTHIGLNSEYMYQIWDDSNTTEFFSTFVKIHIGLKDYKMTLMKEASEDGVPPLRSLLLEYPEDAEARKIKDQFMLGTDLLMAPIVKAGSTSRKVYLPKGKWTHFFTKEIHDFSEKGGWLKKQNAEIGTPLVFVKGDLSEILL